MCRFLVGQVLSVVFFILTTTNCGCGDARQSELEKAVADAEATRAKLEEIQSKLDTSQKAAVLTGERLGSFTVEATAELAKLREENESFAAKVAELQSEIGTKNQPHFYHPEPGYDRQKVSAGIALRMSPRLQQLVLQLPEGDRFWFGQRLNGGVSDSFSTGHLLFVIPTVGTIGRVHDGGGVMHVQSVDVAGKESVHLVRFGETKAKVLRGGEVLPDAGLFECHHLSFYCIAVDVVESLNGTHNNGKLATLVVIDTQRADRLARLAQSSLLPQVGVDIPRSGEAVQLFAKSSDSDCANLQVSH